MTTQTAAVQPAQNGAVATSPPSVKNLMSRPEIKKRFEELMKENAESFISSVLTAVSNSDSLAKADPNTVLMAAVQAATLKLPINPNLGLAFIIPYKTTITNNQGQREDIYVAQFQMGYKGFVQLAMRTGQYEVLNCVEVYDGQLKKFNPLTEEYEFDWEHEGKEVIGFVAHFKTIFGFKKTVYWNVGKMLTHAKRHSKAFSSGPWKTDFIEMGKKTLLKNTLSKYGVLSIEVQRAERIDQAVIKDEKAEKLDYIDSNTEEAEHTEVNASSATPASTIEENQPVSKNDLPEMNELL